jgi:hypothetical protein
MQKPNAAAHGWVDLVYDIDRTPDGKIKGEGRQPMRWVAPTEKDTANHPPFKAVNPP